jgi:hypothetical protein
MQLLSTDLSRRLSPAGLRFEDTTDSEDFRLEE